MKKSNRSQEMEKEKQTQFYLKQVKRKKKIEQIWKSN